MAKEYLLNNRLSKRRLVDQQKTAESKQPHQSCIGEEMK